MGFSVGSLVKARGREWVVLPESQEDLLVVRPLGGTQDEVAGIYLPLETVEPARFDLPDPQHVGDHRSCRLLRDAVRLASRSSTGPFRCFARVAVEPRPYQLVPLLMALRLEPIRLLVADDVGVGKTIEACLVARELLDRGEVNRLTVLCPPHLAEQWQAELNQKFHIDAELVLSSTASRLERRLRLGQSLFEVYPHTVVSLDYIKSDRRRDEFARTCPELVIVDEAHTCVYGYERRGGKHQRHQLVKQLADDPSRHMIFVTATPHSGKEEAFRSLLRLLNPDFTELPEDLSGPENERHRRHLAQYFVQRRRGDIRYFMKEETPFPEREEREDTYRLTAEYRRFFDRVLRYTQETVQDETGGRQRQRVRWWSALALLRSVGSSPAAAAATLRNRTPTAEADNLEEVDEIGRRTVLDIEADEPIEGLDVTPGSDTGEETEDERTRRRLLEMAREAEKLAGDKDAKVAKAADLVKELLKDGYQPILFCRFIPTADYVAEELRKRLPNDVEVASVTGTLPPSDRETRVLQLAEASKRVLVATECLSEGINLQEHFSAVMHYDLSWNPTRHEQREGRVDRFGQPRSKVRVLTYYGADNPIDGMVLDVLIRKHKTIRTSLGISVPVPVDTESVIEAIVEGVLFRRQGSPEQRLLPGFEDYLKPQKERLYAEWENAADREKRSRTMFAQETIKAEEIAPDIQEARNAVGTASDVERFTIEALKGHRATVSAQNGQYRFELSETPRALRDALQAGNSLEARFEMPVPEGVAYLNRTHPFVEALASHVMDTALDPQTDGIAYRAGAIRTAAVATRTTLLLVRFRFDITTSRSSAEHSQLAEECRLMAFAGAPENAEWLDTEQAEALLDAEPAANILSEQKSEFVARVVQGFDALRPHIEETARSRGEELLDAHKRVRSAARMRGMGYTVESKLPPDILGVYVFLPAPGGRTA